MEIDKLEFPCTGQVLASRLEDLRLNISDAETKVSNGISDLSLGASQVGDLLYTFRNESAVGTKYLLCDGGSYNESDYPDLYAIIGDGTSTEFSVPNLHSEANGYYTYIRALPSSTTGGTSNE